MTDDLADWERDLLKVWAARDDEQAARDKADAMALRVAAKVLLRRSKRPRSIILAAVVKALRNAADRIEDGE